MSARAHDKDDLSRSFLEWANPQAIPVEIGSSSNEAFFDALTNTISNATIVAISEGFHNCKEMMTLHQQIIQYLVEQHGFATVITESGLPESRLIHDYVLGKLNPEDEKRMYQKGLNKMYSAWREGRELIEWIRHYNQEQNNVTTSPPVAYYGSDIGGFYQDWKTPFKAILEYLTRVDKPFHDKLSSELEPFLSEMSQNARLNYQDKLTRLEKAQLEVILEEALQTMDSNRAIYIEQGSSESDYEWARQCLESMRLAEHYYRNYEQRCHPETSKMVGLNGREVAMHRNTLWALEQERNRLGRPPKAIVISHVIHTKTESQYQDELWGFFTPAGQMLKQSLGDKFCVIGTVYEGGEYWKQWQKGPEVRHVASIPAAKDDGIEQVLGEVLGDNYFLPWNKAPLSAQEWLSSLCVMRENDYFINIRPMEWDGCVFLRSVQPATPAEKV